MRAVAEKSSRAPAQVARKPFVAPASQRSGFIPGVQAKMTVSEPGDRLEQEADRTADRVARMPTPAPIQRRLDDRKDTLDRAPSEVAAVPAVTGDVQSAIRAKSTGGEPLAPDVRAHMEPRFGADFSGVRIHRDAEAAVLSNRLSARAFTYRNHIFFADGQYRPGTGSGQHLLAHELTHTIQQGAAIQRSPAVTVGAATPTVQRLGIQTLLDKFADWATAIPGYTMLTVVLGFNPISTRSVDRSGANLLRALIELVPGGTLIRRALDAHGVINKAADWIGDKIAELGDIGAEIVAALAAFIDSLGLSDVVHPGDVWDRAKRIFTGPINRLIDFGISTAVELLKIVKDAILKPLAALAEGTRGYPLLCALLGEDPITGAPVPRNAETLIGGFMTLIGHQEIWENIKKGNAIQRAWKWFQTALDGLMGLVHAIPARIIAAFTSLTFADVISVAGAFAKIGGAFLSAAGTFFDWGLTTIWNLLEIVFDVVKPGLMGYIRRTGAALKGILKNPLPFLGHLIDAAKLGFANFRDHIGRHMKEGLIDWLTGALEGVYIPKALTLPELGRFGLSVLGISWAQVRGKIVKALGAAGEKIMTGLELALDVVKALVTGGVAAVWDLIRDKLTELKDQVVNGIIGFVSETIVKKAIPKLLSLFIPGAGFISAIVSIYDTIMVFVEKISKIIQVVTAFIDSIVTIAAGNIGAAAKRVEGILGNLLSLAIAFLAGFLSLGKITDKIKEVIEKIRASVDKALDAAVAWIVEKAKALFGSLMKGVQGVLNWWKKRLSFTAGGEKHELYFEGEEDSAEPVVASNPKRLQVFVDEARNNAEITGNDKKKKALDRVAAEIPVLRKIRADLRPLKDAPDAQRQPHLDKLDASFLKIGADLAILLGDSKSGLKETPIPLGWPKPSYSGYLDLHLYNLGTPAAPSWKLTAKARSGTLVATYRPSGSHKIEKGPPAAPTELKRLGITSLFQLKTGMVVGPVTEASTPGGAKINGLLERYGWNATEENMDGDHVVEIQFGGQDDLANLWPLDAGVNRGAGSALSRAPVDFDGQPLTVDWLKKVKKKPADAAKKYFFRIASTT